MAIINPQEHSCRCALPRHCHYADPDAWHHFVRSALKHSYPVHRATMDAQVLVEVGRPEGGATLRDKLAGLSPKPNDSFKSGLMIRITNPYSRGAVIPACSRR